MILDIITPAKTIREKDVDYISLEGTEGSLGILPGHMPLLAELKVAPLHIKKKDKTDVYAVMGGIARVMSDFVMIITEDAEHAMEIDVLKAKKEKEAAEAYLTRKTEMIDMIKVEVQLRKALVRLKVAEYNKGE